MSSSGSGSAAAVRGPSSVSTVHSTSGLVIAITSFLMLISNITCQLHWTTGKPWLFLGHFHPIR